MDILKRIVDLRKERNWTEYQLAEQSGLTQSTISSWYRKNTSHYSFINETLRCFWDYIIAVFSGR